MSAENKDWDICMYFFGRSDFGFANAERRAEGYTYSRPYTVGGVCYAKEKGLRCHRRGKCVIRKTFRWTGE